MPPSRDRIDPLALLGEWTFDRDIDDRMAGERLTVDGRVEFVRESDVLVLWRERGTLHRQGVDLPVERTLRLVRRPEPHEGWDVEFEDGREFHPWSPQAWVEHLCGADTYRGLVEPGGVGGGAGAGAGGEAPSAWTVTWEVSGPRKDYTMVTRLHR